MQAARGARQYSACNLMPIGFVGSVKFDLTSIMDGEHTMRCSKKTLAVALAVGSLLSIASTANGVNSAPDRLTATDRVQDRAGGHRPPGHHCWYRGVSKFGPDHWHGPGWYWCGYRLRHVPEKSTSP
jgi:hypothetical protein